MISIDNGKIIIKAGGILPTSSIELVIDQSGILIIRGFPPYKRLISWGEINEIGVAKSYGSLVIRMTDDKDGSWPLGTTFQKIKKDGYWNLGIDLFSTFKELKAETYYKLIESLSVLVKETVKRDFVYYSDSGKLFLPSFFVSTANTYSNTCINCNKNIKWEIKPDPYIFECGNCHEKCFEVNCPKCGWGGVISSKIKGRGLLGIVGEIETRPSFWECTSCHNHWLIDPAVYDEAPVVAEVI